MFEIEPQLLKYVMNYIADFMTPDERGKTNRFKLRNHIANMTADGFYDARQIILAVKYLLQEGLLQMSGISDKQLPLLSLNQIQITSITALGQKFLSAASSAAQWKVLAKKIGSQLAAGQLAQLLQSQIAGFM